MRHFDGIKLGHIVCKSSHGVVSCFQTGITKRLCCCYHRRYFDYVTLKTGH